MKNKLLGLMAVGLLFFTQTTKSQSIPSYLPKDGLVGWWPFNGNANDESGNGNNGTVNGATLTTDRFGNAGKAYSFDGDQDFIVIGNESNFDFETDFSINAWVNMNQNIQGQKMIVTKFKNFDDSYSLAILNNIIQITLASAPTKWTEFLGTSKIDSMYWANVTLVLSNQNLKVYLNGVKETSAPYFAKVFNSQAPVVFGDFYGNNWNPRVAFEGKLDDIAIWNRALSEQEIKNLYTGNICYQNVSVTDTLFINSTITSFNPITYENTIKIYPNPSQGQLTVDFGNINTLSGYQMKVINPIGQQIFQSNITQRISNISLSSFSAKGIYFVQLIDSKGEVRENRKIVIQ